MNQISSRLVFQNGKNAIKRAGLNPASAVLSQSYLRFEVPMSLSSTTYTFDTLVNENANNFNTATSFKLNLQDAFVTSSIGLFWADTTSLTNANYNIFSFDDRLSWSENAWGLYNANIQLTVNQRTILTGWDTSRHYVANQYQNGSVVAAQQATSVNQLNLADDGFYPVEPNVVMVGSKKNILQLVLPQALQSLPTSGAGRIICIFRGLLAQNVTPVN
jgi:hypothetical protein